MRVIDADKLEEELNKLTKELQSIADKEGNPIGGAIYAICGLTVAKVMVCVKESATEAP